ncbi:GbsR/MarR family transcriptional regulator [Microbacterium alcoholitolerans]|uniref:GbsR/MarR family transcriptional regulator n=1 Tax=unclassified Microbacterium TaxID=2609290 RepID=UPI000AEE02BF
MSTPSHDAHKAKRAAFVEKVGLQVESTGWMPRMSGRVLGLLLVSEQPVTQAEIREELLASVGAISSASRELIAKRLARRVSIPGSRHTAMELHPDAWRSLEEDGLRGVQDYSALARGGLEDFAPHSAAARNLQRMRDYFAVVEERMQHVLGWLDETAPRG